MIGQPQLAAAGGYLDAVVAQEHDALLGPIEQLDAPHQVGLLLRLLLQTQQRVGSQQSAQLEEVEAKVVQAAVELVPQQVAQLRPPVPPDSSRRVMDRLAKSSTPSSRHRQPLQGAGSGVVERVHPSNRT